LGRYLHGENTLAVIGAILGSYKVEQQGYKACCKKRSPSTTCTENRATP